MWTRGWTYCVPALALALSVPVCAGEPAGSVAISLRVEWVLQEGAPWQGTVRIESGTIGRFRRLSFAVEGLSVRQVSPAELQIEAVPIRAFSGLDFELRCPLEAKLFVTTGAGGDKPVEVVVADLLHAARTLDRSEEHTSELQTPDHLV